jgi:hypothetical protein
LQKVVTHDASVGELAIKKAKNRSDSSNELFGIWKDNEKVKDVNKYVRTLRKGRFNAAD